MVKSGIRTLGLTALLTVGAGFYLGGQPSPSPSAWELLKKLLPIHGVSGHETGVADYIQSRLPDSVPIERDDMSNVWFTTGEGSPHILFVAHTDELGLVVDSITSGGRLKVQGRGGFFPRMYEGRPVVIRTSKGDRNGVVAPRTGYLEAGGERPVFSLKSLEIDLGVDTAEGAAELGVTVGDPVTIRKKIVDLTPDLLAARGVDDRAGCAALLAAALRIDWSNIENKTVTFAWDVEEEVGLRGASRLSEHLEVDVVFPVDTFVASMGPFDTRLFGMTPLGEGAVIRAIDSSSLAPFSAVRKVLGIAEAHGIPVQLGNTHGGGNDGSVFVPKGAADVALSWPGVYSHSFVEKIHRRDLEALADLIVALVNDW